MKQTYRQGRGTMKFGGVRLEGAVLERTSQFWEKLIRENESGLFVCLKK